MKNNKIIWFFGIVGMIAVLPQTVSAMHIMEGFLPPKWCISWGALSIPFILVGFYSIRAKINMDSRAKLLLAMAGAFTFVLSALKIPSVTGSCSHPTGVGLGAILFGPTAMAVIGLIVLLFQAVLLAHGGLSTLGANIFSMAIVGPIFAYLVYKLVKKINVPKWIAGFLAASLGDMATYITTSVQLALAFPDTVGGFMTSLSKFLGVFAITQIPLAISEGILTVIIFNAILAYNKDELISLNVISKEV